MEFKFQKIPNCFSAMHYNGIRTNNIIHIHHLARGVIESIRIFNIIKDFAKEVTLYITVYLQMNSI